MREVFMALQGRQNLWKDGAHMVRFALQSKVIPPNKILHILDVFEYSTSRTPFFRVSEFYLDVFGFTCFNRTKPRVFCSKVLGHSERHPLDSNNAKMECC